MKNEHIIPALEKTIRLLEYLGSKSGGASQSELASELDISPSTCYRIIQTLRKYDWVRQLPGNLYDLSNGMLPIMLKLSDRSARFESVQPILDQLTALTTLSSKLSIRQGSEQVTILRAESPRPMTVSGKVGARFPIIEGSVGAALLRDEAVEDIQQLTQECREEIAERSSLEIITARIQTIEQTGYCLNAAHNRWKVDAMSAPVADASGRTVAAITLLGFDEDFRSQHLEELSAHLLKAAGECQRLI